MQAPAAPAWRKIAAVFIATVAVVAIVSHAVVVSLCSCPLVHDSDVVV